MNLGNSARKSAIAVAKQQNERRIFELLVPLAELILTPNSIQQKNPPAPDIECQVQNTGPLAVELVALDAENTRKRLNNMHSTGDSWESALQAWSTAEQETLRATCKNVHLNISGLSNTAGKRDRTQIMRLIQERLLAQPTGFTGDLYSQRELYDFRAPLHHCRAVTVIRGDDILNGPRINAPSGGSWQMPQILKIEEKLTVKTYDTPAPLELWAYSEHDEVDAHVDSLTMIDKCVTTHLGKSQFQRVLVFDLWFNGLKRIYTR
jgi:hypothetical protein